MLELDGRRVALTPLEHRVQARPGAGGLETLRFDAVYAAPEGSSGRTLAFRDLNFERRLGWKEVVVVANGGAEIETADVPSTSTSDALRAYPADLLASPLDVTAARVEYEPGTGPGAAPQLQGGEAAGPSRRRVRIAGRAGGPRRRRGLRLAPRGDVLGRRARAHARAREGDRRRLPRRHPGQAATRRAARPDRHRDAHRRRLRPRARHAPALPLHRPRAPVSVADARLRRARRGRRGERPRGPGAPSAGPPPQPRTTTIIITTRTSTTTAGAGCSGWASPPASCPARRRSSSC